MDPQLYFPYHNNNGPYSVTRRPMQHIGELDVECCVDIYTTALSTCIIFIMITMQKKILPV